MTLDRAHKGQLVEICSLPAGTYEAQALRFGISPGEQVVCAEKLRSGPVIIQKNRQEIAVGHNLARKILVRPVRTGNHI